MRRAALARKTTLVRKTRETDIRARLNLDGAGKASVKTGLPFLDHMLTLVATHGLFDLALTAKGDLDVDIHHTNEDVGLVLGQALHKALGDHAGIHRYGWCYVPMEEALVRVVLDISGRPKLVIRDKRRPPKPLRGSNYAGAKKLGHGEGYVYPHDDPAGFEVAPQHGGEYTRHPSRLGALRHKRWHGQAHLLHPQPRARAEPVLLRMQLPGARGQCAQQQINQA